MYADPDPDPAAQINADPCGSGSETLLFWGVKILNFFDEDPGSGMETVQIRDGKCRIRDPG